MSEQATVKALVEGRMAFPTGAALRSPYWQNMLAKVAQADPTFDAVNYNARAATRKDFTSGMSARNITAFNTALGHLGTLWEAGKALDNGSFKPWNSLANATQRELGDPRVDTFNAARQAAVDELEKAFRGSNGTQAGIDEWKHSINSAQSPAQLRAVIGQMVDLLGSRINAMGEQYKAGMGRTVDGISLLDPHAQAVFSALKPGGTGSIDQHPSITSGGGGSGGGPGSTTVATGDTRTERDPKASAMIDSMIRAGASPEQINAALKPLGFDPVNPDAVTAAREHLRRNPGFKGSYGEATKTLPTTAWNRFSASPVGTGLYAAVDAGLGGLTDEITAGLGGGDLADLNARKQAAFALNPKATFAGEAAGMVGSMSALSALGRATGVASRFANAPLAGDLAFGAISGAGQSNDNRLIGGALGTIGGGVGNLVGNTAAAGIGALARTRAGMAATNGVRGMFGRGPLPSATPLSSANSAILAGIDRAGADNVTNALTEAQTLGIPMSLADTNPNLRELAGAAVRRSPTAASYAENALIPRARGQYDRFTSAVETNLGPTTNIPQRSADLMAQGRAAANDLYDRAYSNPVPSTPEMDAVLGTPFGRQALGRAKTIAANERRSPDELGFALDERGEVVLNPRPGEAIARHLAARQELDAAQDAYRAARGQPGSMDAVTARVERARQGMRDADRALAASPDPSVAASVPSYTTQTLDYVKRGMDDVLEEKRNPITSRLVLDEAGRAQNQVRGQLLSEVDRLNPDYAQARAAYAGPMQSRDALVRGQDAYGLHPDELGMQVAGQTPEHLGQMQLGYRGAMVDHAGKVRDNSNPWDATLGSPVSRERLGTLYPDNPGVDSMLRQLDLERTMALTKDGVIGNSKTAGRQVMDKVFEGGGWPVAAAEAGLAVLTHGATLPLALRRFAGESARDMYKLGVGNRATAKADALSPALLNPDPNAALTKALELLEQQRQWQALVTATKPKRLGMFGGAIGSQAATQPLN